MGWRLKLRGDGAIFFHLKKNSILSRLNKPSTLTKPSMNFTRIIPSIFYVDIQTGLKTFVDCLEFRISHEELNSANPYCVVKKDELSILLFQNAEYARQFSPEYRLVTNNIEEVYARVSSAYPEMLHPNLNTITLRPWGAREFALVDGQIGVIFQQW